MSKDQYWQELLAVLPESLHPVVKPHLESMDQKVNEAFRNIHSQYDGFKQFKDANVDPQYLVTAYNFTKNFEANPAAILAEANKTYDLGFLTAEEAQALGTDDDDDDFGDDDMDITRHPQFQAMQQTLEQIQSTLTEKQQQELLEQQTSEHEKYLQTLLTGDNEHVDRDFVTALMSQGLTGEQAVERWNTALAQRLGQDPSKITIPDNNNSGAVSAPVVMGGNGGSGSGIPEQPIDFAAMKGGDVNDLVIQMLQQSASGNNQG